MTPYDLCALRLGDGAVLAGAAPDGAGRYLDALRAPGARAAAAAATGLVTAADVASLVERLCGMPWDEAEALARGAGALVGAYPSDTA